jgi:hypothetical protein
MKYRVELAGRAKADIHAQFRRLRENISLAAATK